MLSRDLNLLQFSLSVFPVCAFNLICPIIFSLQLEQKCKVDDHDVKGRKAVVIKKEVKDEIDNHTTPPGSGTGGKRHRKSKGSKQRKLSQQPSEVADGEFHGTHAI